MAAPGAWKLRAELIGHEQDVRDINNCDTGLVTCSRDKSIRIWTPVDATSFESSQVLIGHEHFVACAIQLPACPAHPSGAIASGGYDRTMSGQTIVKPVINIWEAGAIVATLEAHTLTVCGLSMTASGHLVSVSWDKTARVWDLNTRKCITVLTGHEQAVWAVLCLEDGRMLTASADKTIKRWNGAACEHTYVGHTDCVRALAMMPGIGFVSTGNDCSIRMWAVSGECLMTMTGHGSFVYSLAVLPTGELVSGGEDRTARVWRDGQCVGTIPHGGSVWSVAALADGDIATACADGVARVFTRDPSRVASTAVLAAHDAMIQAQQVSAAEVGGVKLDQLPGIEALDTPGGKDGQTKIVRVDNKAYAYSWNSVESKWDQVGTVVDGPAGSAGAGAAGAAGGSGPGEVNGVKYDRVFDIEIDEGVTLKLGYNSGQNPYSVAQDFIWANDLPQEHLDQIANFIDKNAAAITLGGDAGMTRGADPLTGSSNAMYEPPRDARSAPSAGGRPGAVTFASSEHIPKRSMIFFDTAGKVDAVEKKMMEFNDALAAGAATQALALTAEEAAVVRLYLIQVAFDKAQELTRPTAAAYDLLANKLLKWPQDKLFPILDVLRMLITNMFAAKHFGAAGDGNILAAVAAVTGGPQEQIAAGTRLMALRLYVNAFKAADTRALVSRNCAAVLESSRGSASYTNQQVQIGYATLLLNVAVHVREVGEDAVGGGGVVRAALSGAAEFLHSEVAAGSSGHEDAIYRVLAGIGTLCQGSAAYSALARELGVSVVATRIGGAASSSQRVRECAQQLCAACI